MEPCWPGARPGLSALEPDQDSDADAGGERRGQGVVEDEGGEQPGRRTGQHGGDHADHPRHGHELLLAPAPQPLDLEPFRRRDTDALRQAHAADAAISQAIAFLSATIADLLAWAPTRAGRAAVDPADRAAYFAAKADLLDRITSAGHAERSAPAGSSGDRTTAGVLGFLESAVRKRPAAEAAAVAFAAAEHAHHTVLRGEYHEGWRADAPARRLPGGGLLGPAATGG